MERWEGKHNVLRDPQMVLNGQRSSRVGWGSKSQDGAKDGGGDGQLGWDWRRMETLLSRRKWGTRIVLSFNKYVLKAWHG